MPGSGIAIQPRFLSLPLLLGGSLAGGDRGATRWLGVKGGRSLAGGERGELAILSNEQQCFKQRFKELLKTESRIHSMSDSGCRSIFDSSADSLCDSRLDAGIE